MEGLRTELSFLKYHNSIEFSYEIVRKAHNSLDWGSIIFILGLLSFLIVLASAAFFISKIFGIGIITFGVILFVFLFRNQLLIKTESDYFNWDLDFNQIEK